MEGCERLFDPAKFFKGKHLHGQGHVDLVLSRSLVDRVGKEFGFRVDCMRHYGFVREPRSKSVEFVLKVCVIHALLRLNVSMF